MLLKVYFARGWAVYGAFHGLRNEKIFNVLFILNIFLLFIIEWE